MAPFGEPVDDRLDRHERAGGVGDMGDRDEPGARRQAAPRSRQIEPAGRFGRRDHEPDADALAQHLPRHDVGMVLEVADQYLVAGFEEFRPPALRDQVDRLGGAAHEDDLARVAAFRKPRIVSRASSNRSVERSLSR